ncbi:hypothetical protein CALCODRAFT_504078 [Calocera cornea HHB12733]|uniref:Transmembrane protein n=1 Tax=Calocera cornea HHB12733 TaxID=1353952 RepID=A0A165CLF1_9BASI|nr:hypothetical protein CALCODRAFT_504078 [Calocera cornea HHB12733]
MSQLTPYNISLSSSSPAFSYWPFRDGYYRDNGESRTGWRSTYLEANAETSYWGPWPAPSLNNWIQGTGLQETDFDSASVTLVFEGTAFYFCATWSFLVNVPAISINDTSVTYSQVEGQSDNAICKSDSLALLYKEDLPYGTHTVQMTGYPDGSESSNFQFYGGIVTVGVNGTYINDVTIQDTDSRWSYDQSWTAAGNNTFALGNSLHRTCSYGPTSSASYQFGNTSAVRLLGQLSIDAGPYTVSLVAQSTNFTVSYNASTFWTTPQIPLFFTGALDPGETYTITLSNYDPQYPISAMPLVSNTLNNTCASIDALVLTQTRPQYPSPPKAPSHTGAIVGGVIGGLAGLGILVWLISCCSQIPTGAARPPTQAPSTSNVQAQPAAAAVNMDVPMQETAPISPPMSFDPDVSAYGWRGELSPARPESISDVHLSPTLLPSPAASRPETFAGHRAARAGSTTSLPTRPFSAPAAGDALGIDLQQLSTAELLRVLNQRLQPGPAAQNSPGGSPPPDYQSF